MIIKNGLSIDEYGNKEWYQNGLPHREDGPAFEYVNGDKYWLIYGKFHREDGPAIEYASGYKSWYLNGEKIYCSNNKEFIRIVKLKAFF